MAGINLTTNALSSNSAADEILDTGKYTLKCVFAPTDLIANGFGVPVYTKNGDDETYYTHLINKDFTALTGFSALQSSDGKDISEETGYHALSEDQQMEFAVGDKPPVAFHEGLTITVGTVPELRGELFEAFSDTEAGREELKHLFAPYNK